MQNIKAKKESLMRLLGMVLILFGLLITLLVDIIFIVSNVALYLLIIIPWFLLIILLKLEIDFVVDRTIIFFIILCVYTIIMSLIALLFISNLVASILLKSILFATVIQLVKIHKTNIITERIRINFFIYTPYFLSLYPAFNT